MDTLHFISVINIFLESMTMNIISCYQIQRKFKKAEHYLKELLLVARDCKQLTPFRLALSKAVIVFACTQGTVWCAIVVHLFAS